MHAFPKVKAVDDYEIFDMKVVGGVGALPGLRYGWYVKARAFQFPQATAAIQAHSGSFAHLTVRSRLRR
jgi:hypothetical protein